MTENRQDNLRDAALAYHEYPKPGKLEVRATKPLANGRDLNRQSTRNQQLAHSRREQSHD